MLLGAFCLDTGILQMVLWGSLLLVGIAMGCGCDAGASFGVGAVCCVFIPSFVFNIMMWVAAFKSDRECGPALWSFAVATIILFLLPCCNFALRDDDGVLFGPNISSPHDGPRRYRPGFRK